MPLTLAPDIERIISDYLRTQSDIVALSTRIVGKTPDNKATSWVRVQKIAAPQVGQPHRLREFMLQFDCYAGATGGQPEANLLAQTVEAALSDLDTTHAISNVTGVEILGGPRGLDTDLEPARDHTTTTALIWAHP